MKESGGGGGGKRVRRNCDQSLPIAQWQEEILTSVRDHKTTVLCGETGSGKSTQLPQYLLASGIYSGAIVCTQPRRVAATTLAARVAQEQGCALGAKVGYTVRFDDQSSAETRIKYVTDGILLRECMVDPSLSRYKVIILDEAHERSVNTDILMGLLRLLQERRPELRIIVMSATLDVALFSSFFLDANVVTVPGRQFHVEILYAKEPQEDYLDAVTRTCVQIHCDPRAAPGDVLVFLPGQEDIEGVAALLEEHLPSSEPGHAGLGFTVTPLYASLPPAMQAAALAPAPEGTRKFILSTNMAETSITINGVSFVVDAGYYKCRTLDTVTGMEKLAVTPVSQAQANQRAGRAGRERDGVCYRVYCEDSFERLPKTTPPEITRTSVDQVILQLLLIGVPNPHAFPYPSPPGKDGLRVALQQLKALGALQGAAPGAAGGAKYALTPVGAHMAALPVDPHFALLLLQSVDSSCCVETVTVVSMLSADTIFLSPTPADKSKALEAWAQFRCPEGDMLALLAVHAAWVKAGRDPHWSRRHFLSQAGLLTADNIRTQLKDVLARVLGAGANAGVNATSLPDKLPLLRCLARGLALRSARKIVDQDIAAFSSSSSSSSSLSLGAGRGPNKHAFGEQRAQYVTIYGGAQVFLHPSSSFFGLPAKRLPDHLVYAELLVTSRHYVRTVCAVEADWLEGAGGGLFRKSVPAPVPAPAAAVPRGQNVMIGQSYHQLQPQRQPQQGIRGGGYTLKKGGISLADGRQ